MPKRLSFIVAKMEDGLSLLQFLNQKLRQAHQQPPSVKAIKRAIEQRNCRVNGELELFSSIHLAVGDKVDFSIDWGEQKALASLVLTILYEDDDLLIVDKPAGVISEDPVFQRLLPQYGKTLFLVHRLDKDTSGAIILAKRLAIKEAMKAIFSRHEVKKTYLALVKGTMRQKQGTIDSYLVKKSSYEGQTIYESRQKGPGQHAVTHWKVLKEEKDHSLVLCEPLTGRTHQLRVHLSSLGHPILGDCQYGGHQEGIKRHMLHAWKLQFPHPQTQQQIELKAPIPADFQAIHQRKQS